MAPPPPAPSLLGLRVLVVDDDRVAATILCAMLRAAGADAEAATSGTDALERTGRTPFDLIVCDVYMPGLDGFEVLRRVRQQGSPASAVPAVAITAHPSYENRRDAQRAGFQDVLSKPVESAELVETVRRLCRPATGPAD